MFRKTEMINHLSEDQLTKCFVGRSTAAELQHIRECAECSIELERLEKSISSFRNALRDHVDDRVVWHGPAIVRAPARLAASGIPKWRWALVVAAVVVVALVPYFTPKPE